MKSWSHTTRLRAARLRGIAPISRDHVAPWLHCGVLHPVLLHLHPPTTDRAFLSQRDGLSPTNTGGIIRHAFRSFASSYFSFTVSASGSFWGTKPPLHCLVILDFSSAASGFCYCRMIPLGFSTCLTRCHGLIALRWAHRRSITMASYHGRTGEFTATDRCIHLRLGPYFWDHGIFHFSRRTTTLSGSAWHSACTKPNGRKASPTGRILTHFDTFLDC